MNPPSKPYLIDKRRVYEAYLEVRSKEGAGGVFRRAKLTP